MMQLNPNNIKIKVNIVILTKILVNQIIINSKYFWKNVYHSFGWCIFCLILEVNIYQAVLMKESIRTEILYWWINCDNNVKLMHNLRAF